MWEGCEPCFGVEGVLAGLRSIDRAAVEGTSHKAKAVKMGMVQQKETHRKAPVRQVKRISPRVSVS